MKNFKAFLEFDGDGQLDIVKLKKNVLNRIHLTKSSQVTL